MKGCMILVGQPLSVNNVLQCTCLVQLYAIIVQENMGWVSDVPTVRSGLIPLLTYNDISVIVDNVVLSLLTLFGMFQRMFNWTCVVK